MTNTWPQLQHETPREHRTRHPGLGMEDSLILNTAIDQNVLPPGKLYVNVHVGPYAPGLAPDDLGPIYAPIAENYRRRCDLVLLADDVAYFTEIKPAASYMAVGQAKFYADVASADAPPGISLRAAVLTDAPDPEILRTIVWDNVYLWTLPRGKYVPRGHPT